MLCIFHKKYFDSKFSRYILQVIIDNEENIVLVQSGFLGPEIDTNCYRQIGSIGPDAHLKFPAVAFLETVFIQTATICTTMALQNLQQYGCQTGNKLKKNHVT
jgi:hypothetical protein